MFGQSNIFFICNFTEKLIGNVHNHNCKVIEPLDQPHVTKIARTLTSDTYILICSTDMINLEVVCSVYAIDL